MIAVHSLIFCNNHEQCWHLEGKISSTPYAVVTLAFFFLTAMASIVPVVSVKLSGFRKLGSAVISLDVLSPVTSTRDGWC